MSPAQRTPRTLVQRRAAENEQRACHDGVVRIVRSLMPVLDHFDLALDQRREQVSIDQLLDGVGMVREEMLKALAAHEVEVIHPKRGDEFDTRDNLHGQQNRRVTRQLDLTDIAMTAAEAKARTSRICTCSIRTSGTIRTTRIVVANHGSAAGSTAKKSGTSSTKR